VERLPDNYRTVLNLFVVEEHSHREIARQLGMKESTSSSLFFRAKKKLAKMIKEYQNDDTT
jgi:RNA polymerase sigma-70 factor (ECF subfamily)